MNTDSNPKVTFTGGSLQRDDLYHKMIEEVEDYAILMMDTEGYILNWNKGAEKIKGYKESEILAKNFRLFYTKEDQQTLLPERLLEEGTINGKAHHEGWWVRKDGTRFWGSIVITAIHANNGEIIGFSKVTRDLTERKLAQEKAQAQTFELAKLNQDFLETQEQLKDNILELKKTNKELEQFAYIACHDLQEPVRKISTYFSMLFNSIEGSFDQKSMVLKNKILASTNRMQTLINDLLALSTISENVEFLPVDLNEICRQASEELEIRVTEKGAILTVQPLPMVMGISSYLVQLFMNLISNSLKFSKRPPLINISAIADGENAIIIVQDNGIGMATPQSHKIFEAFQRLHPKHQYEGTGIGLAICKRIVDVHKGKIAVDSELGVGTTFKINLALA